MGAADAGTCPLIRRCTFLDVRQQVTWQVLITDGDIPLLMAAVDFAKEDAVRSQIPVLQQLRTDIYEVCEKTVG